MYTFSLTWLALETTSNTASETQWGTMLMVGVWNALPGRVVEAENLTIVKKSLDEHLKCQTIQGYGASAGKWD